MSTFCQFIVPNALDSSVITIILLPQLNSIHKTPMVGRPIAASHSYITRPISIFVDELFKPKIHMPTVLRDSCELIRLLENTVLPKSNCFLVTAEVVSLYPNVDIKKALVALDLLLREGQAPETPLLVQLARLVLENNYLSSEFSLEIFHQEYGIAMGSPFAVTVANAFMYLHENVNVDRYSSYLFLYKRFIDDILAIWDGPKDTLLEFLDSFNSKTDRIKFTCCISTSSISFLNLFLYRDISSNVTPCTPLRLFPTCKSALVGAVLRNVKIFFTLLCR